MKKVKFIFTLIIAGMFTACGNLGTPSEIITLISSDQIIDEAESGEGLFNISLFGFDHDLEKASKILGPEGSESTPEEVAQLLENGEWLSVSWDGFYIGRKSTGASFNSIDNPDFYLPETMGLNIQYPSNTNSYEKIQVGERYGSLAVTEANFSYQGDSEYQESGSWVTFEGDMTMEGYITVMEGEEGYLVKGDIIFIPDAESFRDLPLPVSINDYLPGFIQLPGEFVSYSDVTYVWPGTIYDENYENVDLSELPEAGEFKRVILTVNEINMSASDQAGHRIHAKIVSIE